MPMPIPATTAARAIEVYQGYGCCSSRIFVKVFAWIHIMFNMLMAYSTYANVLAVCCSAGRLREMNALFVLLNINGIMSLFGVFFGIIFSRGASNGDMNDLNRYRTFALFSILIHLNVLFAFVILEEWNRATVSVSWLVMHGAGLSFVAGIDSEIKMIGKMLIREQLVRNKQEKLPGAPPPYSTLLV